MAERGGDIMLLGLVLALLGYYHQTVILGQPWVWADVTRLSHELLIILALVFL